LNKKRKRGSIKLNSSGLITQNSSCPGDGVAHGKLLKCEGCFARRKMFSRRVRTIPARHFYVFLAKNCLEILDTNALFF